MAQTNSIVNRYGRLNVSGTILSKRKLIVLIEGENGENRGKYAKGWDDPRLFTLVGLRRRGIPPEAILSFVNELGVSKAKTTIKIPRFENAVRAYLETTVPRLMLVVDPIRVDIEILPDDHIEMIELPFFQGPKRWRTYNHTNVPRYDYHANEPVLQVPPCSVHEGSLH